MGLGGGAGEQGIIGAEEQGIIGSEDHWIRGIQERWRREKKSGRGFNYNNHSSGKRSQTHVEEF